MATLTSLSQWCCRTGNVNLVAFLKDPRFLFEISTSGLGFGGTSRSVASGRGHIAIDIIKGRSIPEGPSIAYDARILSPAKKTLSQTGRQPKLQRPTSTDSSHHPLPGHRAMYIAPTRQKNASRVRNIQFSHSSMLQHATHYQPGLTGHQL